MTEASTAREALIAELLSDVGRLHDEVKELPHSLKLSMGDSLRIVADAVEDAEKTARMLQETTNEVMRATSAKACVEIGMELSTAISQSMERAFEPALNRAAVKIEQFQKSLASLSGEVRDRHATRFNYLVLGGFIFAASAMMGSMAWMAVNVQSVNETNKWFYEEYKAQRAVIDSLPPDIKQRFKR